MWAWRGNVVVKRPWAASWTAPSFHHHPPPSPPYSVFPVEPRFRMILWRLAFALVLCTPGLVQSVTIHYAPGQTPLGTGTAAAGAAYTGAAAYNPTTLTPPPVPTSLKRNFQLSVVPGGVPGLSIKIPGRFFGFSIEMSVVDQIRECGPTRTIFCY